MTESLLPSVILQPVERGIAEGNLLENPIFVLSKRAAKPKGMPTREIDLGDECVIGGEIVRRRIRVVAGPEYGFPTSYAERVLYAILNVAQKRFGRPDPITNPWPAERRKVPVSRAEIARELGIVRPSSTDYRNIANACHAMKNTSYELHGAWTAFDDHDKTKRRRQKVVRSVSLLTDVQFFDERLLTQAELRLPSLASRSQSFVELGALLFESLVGGFVLNIDLQYMNALSSSPLAHRMYGYLTKKDGPSGGDYHTENIFKLARKLGLSRTKRSGIEEAFNDALALLSKELPVSSEAASKHFVRFVKTWKWDGDAITIWFWRDAGRRTPHAPTPPTPPAPPVDESLARTKRLGVQKAREVQQQLAALTAKMAKPC